jgi:hypothetical protein
MYREQYGDQRRGPARGNTTGGNAAPINAQGAPWPNNNTRPNQQGGNGRRGQGNGQVPS